MPPKSINMYIKQSPVYTRKMLRELYRCIKKHAPHAKEEIKWSMPAFSMKRILLTFAAHKHHIGLYPTPSVLRAFEKELTKFHTAKGSIQFPYDKPLPLPLIKKIVKYRMKELLQEDKKWK